MMSKRMGSKANGLRKHEILKFQIRNYSHLSLPPSEERCKLRPLLVEIINNYTLTTEQQKELVKIKRQIVESFDASDWIDLAFSIGCHEIVDSHPRLLRSLGFGDEDYEPNVLEVLALMIKKDSKNFDEIKAFVLDKTSGSKVSEFVSTAHSGDPKKIVSFSPQVFEIPEKLQNEKLVAVMLPFSLGSTFKALKEVCEKQGLECVKADDIWENSTFIQDIFELIFTSRVVVVDFSGKNPNVFYEAGIAHTLGKTVIPISQSINDVPSDLRQHRVLVYHPNEQGLTDLQTEIGKRLQTLIPNEFPLW
jgi:hypothetical protein